MAAISPVVSRLGQGTPNRGTGSALAPMRVSPTTSPWNCSAASRAERRVRWGSGPGGHITEKASVSTASSDPADSRAATYCGWAPDSSVASSRVPTRTPAPPPPRAGGQAGRDPAGGADPARRHHRDLDGVQDLGQQRQQGDPAADP